jgi:hypothetical protein
MQYIYCEAGVRGLADWGCAVPVALVIRYGNSIHGVCRHASWACAVPEEAGCALVPIVRNKWIPFVLLDDKARMKQLDGG